ncbi:acyl-CoA N-acyltransferase [Pavlovales sp. CCMP2436]|nr:acyl-CoA N-acyltransferase [Pavlovales sp. CCMP2436]
MHTHPERAVVYMRDVLIGAYCCRMEGNREDGVKLYILTIGVLEPYRRLGIGDRMLTYILAKVSAQFEIKEVYLHVQLGNDAALAFYQKQDFCVDSVVPDYYKNIEPTGATLLRKSVNQP